MTSGLELCRGAFFHFAGKRGEVKSLLKTTLLVSTYKGVQHSPTNVRIAKQQVLQLLSLVASPQNNRGWRGDILGYLSFRGPTFDSWHPHSSSQWSNLVSGIWPPLLTRHTQDALTYIQAKHFIKLKIRSIFVFCVYSPWRNWDKVVWWKLVGTITRALVLKWEASFPLRLCMGNEWGGILLTG